MAKSKSAKGKKLMRTTSYTQHQKKRQPMAHFTMEDGKVTQNVPTDQVAWVSLAEGTNMDELDNCPYCTISWVGEPIPEEHREYYGSATHFRQHIIGVEYSYDSPERYDGVSEWRCDNCGTRWGRWTGKVLSDGEVEPRYGESRG